MNRLERLGTVLLAVAIFSGCNKIIPASSPQTQSKTQTSQVAVNDLVLGLSADGRIKLPVTNMSFEANGTIKGIYVSNGDFVKKGQLLAELDDSDLALDLKNAKIALEKAEATYRDAIATADYNMKSELSNLETLITKTKTPFDDYTYTQNIINAEATIEKKLKELADAETAMEAAEKIFITSSGDFTEQDLMQLSVYSSILNSKISWDRKKSDLLTAQVELADLLAEVPEAFDDYTYKQNIENAKLSLQRKQDDYDEAMRLLEEAKAKNTETFDDYTYKQNISTAEENLKRKQDDLSDAEKLLKEAKDYVIKPFDPYTYLNEIEKAQDNLQRKSRDLYNSTNPEAANDAYLDAIRNLATVESNYNRALTNYDSDEAEKKRKNIEDNEKKVEAARLAVQDAETNLKNAEINLERAIKDYDEKLGTSVEDAQKKVNTAKQALDDAQQSLVNAEASLTRAADKSIEDAQKKVTQAQMSADDAQIAFMNQFNDTKKKLEAAATALTDAESALQTAKDNLERAIENYDKDIESSKKSLDMQKLKIANMENNTSSITNAFYSVEDAKLKVSSAENALTKTIIISPIDGKVLNVSKKVGEIVSANNNMPTINFGTGASASGVVTICDTSAMYLSANITEGDIINITNGQTIKVALDALDGEIVYAKVISISSIPSVDSSGIVTYEVVGQLDKVDERIRDNMSAFLTFIQKEKKNVLTVAHKAIFVENGQQYVNVLQNDGTTEKRAVTCGLSNGTLAEVLEGITAGETVIVKR